MPSNPDMRVFLEALKFPSAEIMEDSFQKLQKEALVVSQLRSLTKDECEEIGLVAEATDIILTVCENCPSYSCF
jgi:hypothetical protein